MATSFLAQLPPAPFVMAYGSGVFQQTGYTKKDAPMIDLVLAVDDPVAWHRDNLQRNSQHYSSLLKHLGPNAIAFIQDEFGARLWFNTLVTATITADDGTTRPQLFKYGVMSVSNLVDDLRNWRSLYVAGRLHKPVSLLSCPDSLSKPLTTNLHHAVSAALLMLPKRFTAHELFVTIAGLSYAGDFRMIIGENPRKVHNIVTGNAAGFVKLYAPILKELEQVVTSSAGNTLSAFQLCSPECTLVQCDSPVTRHQLTSTLPSWLQGAMAMRLAGRSGVDAVEWMWRHLRTLSREESPIVMRELMMPSIASVVGRHARTQSIKGIATAGASKSVTYAAAKLAKMFK